MTSFNQESQVPSRSGNLLSRFAKARLVRLSRYSWWPAESVAVECDVSPEEAFSMTAGPLALKFESGATLGLASDPGQNSVVVWLDRDDSGVALRAPAMEDDPEIFAIEATDPEFSQPAWAGLVGLRVTGASVLCIKSASALKSELPNEVGLRIRFEGGQELVAAHGLHDASDDFAVLRSEQILPELQQQLEERVLF